MISFGYSFLFLDIVPWKRKLTEERRPVGVAKKMTEPSYSIVCIVWVECLVLVGDDELVDAPVLIAGVGQVTPDDDGNLALLQLFHGDLQRVRFALKFDHDGRAHGDLQRPRP